MKPSTKIKEYLVSRTYILTYGSHTEKIRGLENATRRFKALKGGWSDVHISVETVSGVVFLE